MLVTCGAWEWLAGEDEIYVTDPAHPALPTHKSWPRLQSVAQAFQLARRPQGLLLAVPGHPLLDDETSVQIIIEAEQQGIETRIIPGVSWLDGAWGGFKPEMRSQISLLDAGAFAGQHIPPFPTHRPALVTGLHQPDSLATIQRVLLSLYPPEHGVMMVAPTADGFVQRHKLALEQLHAQPVDLPHTVLYVPPLAPETAYEPFAEVVAHLRAPEGGCPWDKEQTHQSLRADLLEEVYELLGAIDQGDVDGMREELGDVLLHVLLQAQIAADAGEFTMADVLYGINTKIVGRHPHVFGETAAAGVQAVLQNWEKLKAKERAAQGKEHKSILDGINLALPALVQAQQFQKRAARVGFDWPDIQGVLDKLQEELQEVHSAKDGKDRAGEIGDVLFVIANLARWYRVDAESALRETNAKFQRRFSYIETQAREQGRELNSMTLEEMDALWNEAKRLEK
jgi:tetrapyrrole methylase family protein/MazG family protein